MVVYQRLDDSVNTTTDEQQECQLFLLILVHEFDQQHKLEQPTESDADYKLLELS